MLYIYYSGLEASLEWLIILIFVSGIIALFFRQMIKEQVQREKEKFEVEERAKEAERQRLAEISRQQQELLKRKTDQRRQEITEILECTISFYNSNYEILRIMENGDSLLELFEIRQMAIVYKKGIYNKAMQQLADNDFDSAYNGFTLLMKLFPGTTEYSRNQAITRSVISICNRTSSFIMSKTYGEPEKNIIDYISSSNVEECINNMQKTGLLYSLWFHAIKQPFDEASFRGAVTASLKLKPKYYTIPVDTLLSILYVLEKHAKEANLNVFAHYKAEIENYIKKAPNEQALIEFASALSWIGNRQMEFACLERLKQKGPLLENLQKRYEVIQSVF